MSNTNYFEGLGEKMDITKKLCQEIVDMNLPEREAARFFGAVEMACETLYDYFKSGKRTMEEILAKPFFVNPKSDQPA